MTTHLTDLNGPLAKLSDAHCLVRKQYDADFLAVAWYHLAPLPTGKWAVIYGVWCQGVGTADEPWFLRDTQAECVGHFVTTARELCHREVPGLATVQDNARRKLWAQIERDSPTPPSAGAPLDGNLPLVLPADDVAGTAVERAMANRRELFALARRATGDHHAAEDAVQDALLAVHKYAATRDTARPFLPWLRAVVRNAARARVRAGGPMPLTDELPEPSVPADHEDGIDRAEAAALVRAAAWGLDPVSREAFRLCYLKGLTHAQIARRLKREAGSVSGLICRARARLRRQLAGAC